MEEVGSGHAFPLHGGVQFAIDTTLVGVCVVMALLLGVELQRRTELFDEEGAQMSSWWGLGPDHASWFWGWKSVEDGLRGVHTKRPQERDRRKNIGGRGKQNAKFGQPTSGLQ